MAEKQDDEKKLGPNATYLNPDGDVKKIEMGGVTFHENEPVNLNDMLGEEAAKPMLQKLAGNKHFKVDGGPDHAKQAEAKAKAEAKEKERDEKEKAEEDKERDKARAKAEANAPDQATLERPASRRS